MIPSLNALSMNALSMRPGDLRKRETHGISQQIMINIQKQAADKALKLAIRNLIAFDTSLTEDAHDRARDDNYSSFKLIFEPYVAELIFHHRTPMERRENYTALRIKFIIQPSEAMRSYMTTVSRFDLRQKLGTRCTTVMSEAYSCLGLFGTKCIPLMINEPDGTISIVDTTNSLSNHHWPNVAALYEKVYGYNTGQTDIMNLPSSELPVLAGLHPTYTKSDENLVGFVYFF